MTQSIETLAEEFADKTIYKRGTDNYARVYQAALAGIKLGREQAAETVQDLHLREGIPTFGRKIAQTIRALI